MYRETFELAFKAIRKNKLRSFLTMLGIIIGTASVIIIMNLMFSLKTFLVDRFTTGGILNVETTIYDEEYALKPSEVERIVKENSDVFSGYSPIIKLSDIELATNEDHYTSSVTGVGLDYNEVKQLDIQEGDFLNYVDISYNKPSAVIGLYTANYLFGSAEAALGQNIRINGQDFVVKGVLQQIAGELLEEGSGNDTVYIPYTNAAKFTDSVALTNVIFEVVNQSEVANGVEIIKDYLYDKTGDEDTYFVMSSEDQVHLLETVLNRITTVLVVVTSISLLVGGIGIMNIMFVSVVERTQEIGVRTAIGANPKTILRQFLIEAITTSVIGGIIGTVIGITFTYLFTIFADAPFVISIPSILLSIGVSVGIGGIFGYLPARRASYMNPIDALNAD